MHLRILVLKKISLFYDHWQQIEKKDTFKNGIHTAEYAQIESCDRDGNLNDIVPRIIVELLQQITHDVSFHWPRITLILHHLSEALIFFYFVKQKIKPNAPITRRPTDT